MGRLAHFGRFLHDFDHVAAGGGMSSGFSRECGKFSEKSVWRVLPREPLIKAEFSGSQGARKKAGCRGGNSVCPA